MSRLARNGKQNCPASGYNRYVDASGELVLASGSLQSAAAIVHTSDDGVEEMHLFFDVGWYDVGSWAWGHFVVEWGTKGVFQVLPCCGSGGVESNVFSSLTSSWRERKEACNRLLPSFFVRLFCARIHMLLRWFVVECHCRRCR